ncbi:MAG: flippase-like domain-containing protein, partial [Clostridia bacterium]|nr:flippase-like domain-containing protein [Clostridia bacterium]
MTNDLFNQNEIPEETGVESIAEESLDAEVQLEVAENFESKEAPEEKVEVKKHHKRKKVLEDHELTHDNIVGNAEERLVLPDEDTYQKPKTKKEKRKKILTSALFIAFNVIAVAVVLILEIKDSNFMGFKDIMARIGAHYEWLILLVLMFIVHMAADTLVFFALIRKCGYGKRLGLSTRVAFLGTYYDNITPWSTGGQPFQMLYMSKANIDTPTAITLPVVKHAIRVFAMDGLAIIFFIAFPTKVS